MAANVCATTKKQINKAFKRKITLKSVYIKHEFSIKLDKPLKKWRNAMADVRLLVKNYIKKP